MNDKNIRISPEVHDLFVKIAEKEDISLRACASQMILFFHRNKVSVKDNIFGGIKGEIDRILKNQKERFDSLLKLNKSTENNYFSPMEQTMNKIWVMLETVCENIMENKENIPIEEKFDTEKIQLLLKEMNKYKQLTKDSLSIIENLLDRKIRTSTNYGYIVRYTETEIKDIVELTTKLST